jgi:nitrogen fixation/metabolism regulation signal transduction histidine kinase
MNLLKNACEAFDQDSQPKERELVLSIGKGPSADGWRVEVADNACGFGADAVPQVFRPAYTTKTRGTGVGLPFVRSVLEAHGGSAELASPGPGLGARAVLDFPSPGG